MQQEPLIYPYIRSQYSYLNNRIHVIDDKGQEYILYDNKMYTNDNDPACVITFSFSAYIYE